MSRHSGKNIIVTGGASGLGEAIARRLAEEGAHVVITDIDIDNAEKLAAELGEHATAIRHDVTSEEDWDAVIAKVRDERGDIHGVVNNAGIAPPGDLMMPLDEWRKVIAVDLDGVFLGTQKGVGAMAQQDGRGTIVNMSSAMAYVGQTTTPAYSAAKAGVIGLTKSAVAYVSAHNINVRINSIHPGTHETPIFINALPHMPEGFREEELGRHPVGHFGNPNGVAATVSFLLDDDAEFYQGAEFVIDGARLAVDR